MSKVHTTRSKSSRSLLAYPPPDGWQRDEAYHELRRLLILQQIPPGSRLTESEWAQQLGVNRSALREALVRLEAESLVERGAKLGIFVPNLSQEDEREVLIVRFSLERTAIELICQAGQNTLKYLQRMQDACTLLEHLIDENYHLSSAEADWRFHEALIEAARNRRLAIAYRHAPVQLLHPHVCSGKAWAHRSRKTVAEHSAILSAILAGDVPKAKQLLRSHLFGSWEQDRESSQKAKPGMAAGG
jgi:DNA-binding GntR family transcriptional regulator